MKIVLTGGPSAGKTSVVEVLHRASPLSTAIVPEAASILFRGGFPRKSETNIVYCQQRAIFYVQKEIEEIIALEGPGKTLICDRGSLDGLAYWPGDEQSFFNSVQSSMEEQIKRYDWVIHMDTAAQIDYQSSDVRIEKSSEALLINERVRHAWRLHPRRVVITNHSNFLHKVDRAVRAVNAIMAGENFESVQGLLMRDSA